MTKVHVQARRYADEGYTVVLIGHEGHEEVVGTMGEAPDATVLVQTVEEAEALDLPPDTKLAYVTQTTLSVDETGRDHHRAAAPLPRDPRAAQGRHLLRDVQSPVGGEGDASRDRPPPRHRLAQLVELEPPRRDLARGGHAGAPHRRRDRDRRGLARRRDARSASRRAHRRRRSSSARVCDWFRARGVTKIEPYRLVEEDVTFRLPVELRRELELAARS